MWALRGNATEGGDVGGGPGKSSLFSLTAYNLEIGLSGAKVEWWVELITCDGSGAFLTVLEKPTERLTFTSGRTHNRSRSPR